MAPSRKLASLYYEISAKTDKLPGQLASAERSFGKLTDFIMKNPVQAAGAVGTALLGVAIKAQRMAAEVEKGMRRVEVAVSGTAEGFKKLRSDIEDMSIATGRSQAELAQAAAEISKSVGTVEEVGQRLNAALLLSQASGEDLSAIVDGLDQVMDTFSISADRASATVGMLYAAAKNKMPITDLFAAIQAAAPSLVQMGIDLETGARALAALGDQGLSARQAARELKALSEVGAEGAKRIQELADTLPPLTDGLDQAAAAADRMNNSSWNLTKRLAAGLGSVMVALGRQIDKVVNPFLQANADLLDILTGRYKNAADAAKELAAAQQGTPTGPNAPIVVTARGGETAEDIRKRQEAQKKAADAARKSAEAAEAAKFAHLDMEIARQKATRETLTLLERVRKELEKQNLDIYSEQWEQIARNVRKVKGDLSDLLPPAEDLKESIDENNEALDENARKAREVRDAFKDAVSETAQIGRGLIDAAAGAGVLSREMASVLNSAVSVGEALASLSTGLTAGGVVGLVGGIANIVGSLFSRDEPEDPEIQRRNEILEENNRRLAELRDQLGELVSVTASGRDIGAIAGVATRLTTQTGGLAGLEQIEFFRPVEDVIADLQRAGVSLEELRKVAEDFGITLSESPTITELEALQGAIRDFKFGAFVESFSSQLSALETGFRLFDITDPIDQAERFLALLADPKIGAPAIANALSGFDLTTTEGVEQARAALQGLFEQLNSGALTAEEFEALLGGLTIDEFLSALGFLDDALDKVTVTALTAAAAFDQTFSQLQLGRQFGDLSSDDFLTGLIEAFGENFKDAAAQLDFSTLEGFKETAGALIDSLFADGELTDQEREQIRVLQILLDAYEDAAAGALSLADTLSSAFADIDIEAIIFGESSQDTFNKKWQRIIAGLPTPEGTGGLTPGGSFDLSTQAGRDEARAALQQLAISQPDLKPLIADLIQDLDRLPELVGEEVGAAVGKAVSQGTSVSGGLQQLTIFQGDRLITLAETQLLRQTQIRDLIAGSVATRPQVLQPPALSAISSGFGGSGTVQQGSLYVSIAVDATGVTEPAKIADLTVDRLLADAMVRARFLSGSNRAI